MLHDTMVVARDKLGQNAFDLFCVAGFIGRTLHFGLVWNSKLEGWTGSKIVLVPNLLTGPGEENTDNVFWHQAWFLHRILSFQSSL